MFQKLRGRVSRYDMLDVAMWCLTIAVVGLVTVAAYSIIRPSQEPWNAVSYVIPAQVITPDNTVPESFGPGEEVPVRITRVTDCVDFDCPENTLTTLVSVRWQLLEDGVEQTTQFAVLEDQEVVLLQGEDYRVDETSINTRQLNPIPVSPQVVAHAADNGGSSTWRIEGTVVPLYPNASPVAWYTQTFTVESL